MGCGSSNSSSSSESSPPPISGSKNNNKPKLDENVGKHLRSKKRKIVEYSYGDNWNETKLLPEISGNDYGKIETYEAFDKFYERFHPHSNSFEEEVYLRHRRLI